MPVVDIGLFGLCLFDVYFGFEEECQFDCVGEFVGLFEVVDEDVRGSKFDDDLIVIELL